MADYVLSAKVTGDSTNFNKAFDSAEGEAESFSNSLQAVSAKAVALGSIIANMAMSVASKMKELASAGIEYNATIQDYTTSFEVMTGSADKATETVENLKKLGAATPFELTDLAETTKLLMNYGFTADDAQNRLMMLGDISQGSAEKMQRIAMAYGQMSSAGKVSLEDVKQMIEAGFNPLQEISESTGESMASLYDRISDGAISVDEITASMQRATSEGGKYYQSMEKQSKTYNGQLSTLQDNLSQILGSITKGSFENLANNVLPIANNVLGNVVDTLSEGSSKVEAFRVGASTLADELSNKFPAVSETVGAVKGKFEEIANSDVFQQMKNVAVYSFNEIKANANGMAESVKDNIKNKMLDIAGSDAFTEFRTVATLTFDSVQVSANSAFSSIQTDIANGVAPFDVVKNAITVFADTVSQRFPSLGSVINTLKENFNNIVAVAQPVFETVKGVITTFVNSLVSGFQQAGGKIGELKNVFSLVTTFVNPFLGLIKNFGPQIGELVKQISGPLQSAFTTLGSTIGVVFAQIAPLVTGLMSTIFSTLSTVIPLVAQLVITLLPMVAQIIAAILPVVSTLLTTVISLITQILPVITQIVTTLLPVIFDIITQLMPVITQIVTILSNLFVAIMPIISQVIAEILPLITTIIDVIAQAVESVLPILMVIINTIVSIIEKMIPTIIKIVSIVATVISNIIQIVTPIISFIGDLIATIYQLILPVYEFISNLIMGILDNIILPIVDIILGVVQNIHQGISEKIENIKNIVSTIKNTFSTIFNNIYKTVKSIMDKVCSVFKTVFSAIQNSWRGLTTFVNNIFDGIENAINTVVNGVKGAINTVISGINGAIDLINLIPGVELQPIAQLSHGTDNWQGGFAYMNEGGRGELVNLPNGSQIIPHDISVAYAKESARANATSTVVIDYDYLINGIANAMCNVQVTYNTNLDSKTVASTTTPLIDRNLGNRADLEKRFGT